MAANRDSIIGLGIVVDGIEKLREFAQLIQNATRTKKGRQQLLLALRTTGFEKGTKDAQKLVTATQKQAKATLDAAKTERFATDSATKRTRELNKEGAAVRKVAEAERQRRSGITRRVGRTREDVVRTADKRAKKEANVLAAQGRVVTAFASQERKTLEGLRRVQQFSKAVGTERVSARLLTGLDPLIAARVSGVRTFAQREVALQKPFTADEASLFARTRREDKRGVRPSRFIAQQEFGESFRRLADKVGRSPELRKLFRSGAIIRRAIPEISTLPTTQAAAILAQFGKLDFKAAAQGKFARGKQFAPGDVGRFLQISEQVGIQSQEDFLKKQGVRLRKELAERIAKDPGSRVSRRGGVLGQKGAAQTRALLGLAGVGLGVTGLLTGNLPLAALGAAGVAGAVAPNLLKKGALRGAGLVGALTRGVQEATIRGAGLLGRRIRGPVVERPVPDPGIEQTLRQRQKDIDARLRAERDPRVSAVDRENIATSRRRLELERADLLEQQRKGAEVPRRRGFKERFVDRAIGAGSFQAAFRGPAEERVPLLNRFFPGTNKRFRGFGTAVRTVAQFAGASAIIFQVATALRDAAGAAIKFESALARIQGVLATRSLTEMLKIEQGVIDSAKKFGIDLLEAASAAEIFAQQGLRATKIVQELDATLAAVRGAGLSINQAKELLTAVRNVSKEEVASLEILDRISRVSARRAISSASLAEALQAAAPIARQLRGDLKGIVDEFDIVIAASTTIVERTRVTGKQAATSLKFILSRLGRPQVLQRLQELGGVKLATAESEGKAFRPLLEILAELSKAFVNLEGTAKSTQFAVALGGARQVVATTALLGNFGEFLDAARLSSIAFGDIQERVAIQMDTFAVTLVKLRTAIRLVGNELINNSVVADVFKSKFVGIVKVIEFLGTRSAFTEAKLALLTAGLFALAGALAAVFKGLKFVAGGFALAKGGKELSFLARGVATLVLGLGRLKLGFLTAGFVVLGGAVGATVATVIALTTAFALLFTGIGLVKKLNAEPDQEFKLNFVNPADLNLFDVPNFREFSASADELGVGVDTLFKNIRTGSQNILELMRGTIGEDFQFSGNFLEDLKAIQEQTGLTRDVLIDLFIKDVGERFPEFATRFEGAGDRIQKVMELIAQTAFLGNAVLNSSLNRISDTITNTVVDVTESISKLADLTRELEEVKIRVPKAIRARFVFQGQDVDRFAGFFKIEKRAEELSEKVFERLQLPPLSAKLFDELLITPIPGRAFGESLVSAAFRPFAGQKEIISTEFLTSLAEVAAQLTPEELTSLADRLTESIQKLLGATKERVGQGRLTQKRGELTAISDVTSKVLSKVKENIRKNLEGPLNEGNRAILTTINFFELLGEGAVLNMSSISAAIIKVKSPLDAFLIDFFTATKVLEANARAAQVLGTTFDMLEEKFKLVTKFTTDLFSLEDISIDAIVKKANEAQRILNAGVRFSREIKVGTDALQATDIGAIGQIAAAAAAGIDLTPIPGLTIQEQGVTLAAELKVKGADAVINLLAQVSVMAEEVREVFGDKPGRIFKNFLGDQGKEELNTFLTFFGKFLQQAGQLPDLTQDSSIEEFRRALDLANGSVFSFTQLMAAFVKVQSIATETVLKHRLALSELASAGRVVEASIKNQGKESKELIDLQTRLDRLGVRPDLIRFIELGRISKLTALEIANAEKLFIEKAKTLRLGKEEGVLGETKFREDLQNLQVIRDETIELAEQNGLTNERLLLLKGKFAVIMASRKDELLIIASISKLEEASLKSRVLETNELITLQTTLARRGLGPGIGQQIELRAIRERTALEISAARELFDLKTKEITNLNIAGGLGPAALIIEQDILAVTRDETIELANQNALEQTRLFLLKEQFAVQEQFLTQRDTNLQARIAGLKQVLSDFDALTSRDFLQTIFGTAGQDLISRQADLFLDSLFDPETGLFASVGQLIGNTGEATIITNAHVQGAILAGPIIALAISNAFRQIVGLPAVEPLIGSRGKISVGRQLLLSAAVLGGNILGAAVGGGGKGAQTGAQIGTLGGTILGTALAAPLGPLAPIIGPILGGIIGGLIGGKTDTPEQQLKTLQVIARNTGEQITLLENTNRLLDPTALAFNLPSRFTLPGFAPGNLGGGGGVSNSNSNIRLEINVTTSDSGAAGQAIAQAVADELSTQFAGGGVFAPRTGF